MKRAKPVVASPLFDDPRVSEIARLLEQAGTSKLHTESVEFVLPGLTLSYRVTPDVKAQIQQLRQGVADSEIPLEAA